MRRNSSESPKRFLNADEIEAAIREVADLAEASGVKVALAGGCALQLYGSQRLTVDIDIVAERPIRGLRKIKPLTFGGYASETSAGTVIDVMIRNDDFEEAFDDALYFAAKRRGLPIRVVRPEHLAAMKMIADRGKDQVDLAWLVTSGTLDVVKTRKVIRKLLGPLPARDFENFATEQKWLKDIGRE